MKVLVIGLGSIGRRHLRMLEELVDDLSVVGLRRYSDSDPMLDEVITDWTALEGYEFDLAIVSSPAPFHVDQLSRCLERGWPTFVEKPVSHTLDGLPEALQTSKATPVLVGYQFHHYPALQTVKTVLDENQIGRVLSVRADVGMYLPDWRPHQDYRDSVSANASLGGGVLLELSHEFDTVRWLFGMPESVFAITSNLSDLRLEVEESAEAILKYAEGPVVSIHVDMVRRDAHRSLTIVGTEGTVQWDMADHCVKLFVDGQWSEIEHEVDRNTMYRAQMKHMLDCIHGATPAVSLKDGVDTLRIVLAAKRSNEIGTWVSPDEG